MSDSPLNCDLPETDLEQQLQKPWYRTQGERLASPPASMVAGVSTSSDAMDFGFSHIDERIIDVRTAFMILRRFQLVPINLFMIVALSIMWIIGQFYYGVFAASAALFVPLWAAVYLFEIFFPLTLPVRIDRHGGVVYVGHRGTFYRIPWNELEVSFSHNLQYLGSGVMWERQYYSHLYLRNNHYFCGKKPKRALQRKRISSTFNEGVMYQRWNFIVRYYHGEVAEKERVELIGINHDSYKRYLNSKTLIRRILGNLVFMIFMPSMFWWKLTPFKFKWPKEIEAIFGKKNYY
ncbi:hypothetical protein [Marinobacter sp. X15-166B]|uniref:hypothetical protein n=1 Tax=Marinobacter sp. X15-166B TaxID=1897620 RepID=UPI00085CBC48|nr:hypothetical protein [Marinobacter sp. X15-166B]OEY65906.1 hypothetical protein BG841_05185 [Marinobacter sp. X15-166B]